MRTLNHMLFQCVTHISMVKWYGKYLSAKCCVNTDDRNMRMMHAHTRVKKISILLLIECFTPNYFVAASMYFFLAVSIHTLSEVEVGWWQWNYTICERLHGFLLKLCLALWICRSGTQAWTFRMLKIEPLDKWDIPILGHPLLMEEIQL